MSKASNRLAATYLPAEGLGSTVNCQYCASHNVRWFTPRSYGDRAAVLLCMVCRRLTIVAPHTRREAQRVEEKQAA